MKKLKFEVGEYGIIVNQQNEFLTLKLVKSEKYPNNSWMLPGGRLNVDDQATNGLLREIKEETGLDVEVVCPCYVARWDSDDSAKYGVFFYCKLYDKQDIELSDEHIDGKWIKFSETEHVSWHREHSKIAAEKAIILINKGL